MRDSSFNRDSPRFSGVLRAKSAEAGPRVARREHGRFSVRRGYQRARRKKEMKSEVVNLSSHFSKRRWTTKSLPVCFPFSFFPLLSVPPPFAHHGHQGTPRLAPLEQRPARMRVYVRRKREQRISRSFALLVVDVGKNLSLFLSSGPLQAPRRRSPDLPPREQV